MGKGDDGFEGRYTDEDGEGWSHSLVGDVGGGIAGVVISKKLGSFCIVVIGSPIRNLVCTDPYPSSLSIWGLRIVWSAASSCAENAEFGGEVTGRESTGTPDDAGALSILNLCLRFKFSEFCCLSFSINTGETRLG